MLFQKDCERTVESIEFERPKNRYNDGNNNSTVHMILRFFFIYTIEFNCLVRRAYICECVCVYIVMSLLMLVK